MVDTFITISTASFMTSRVRIQIEVKTFRNIAKELFRSCIVNLLGEGNFEKEYIKRTKSPFIIKSIYIHIYVIYPRQRGIVFLFIFTKPDFR